MKRSFDTIKTRAREAISGERIQGAALVCISACMAIFFSLINFVINRLMPQFTADVFWAQYGAEVTCGAALISFILAIFMINPLRVYTEAWFVSNLAANSSKFEMKGILPGAGMGTLLLIYKLAWLVIYMLLPAGASAALMGVLSLSAINARTAAVLAAGTVLLILIGLGFWLFTIQRYDCAMFYLVTIPDMTVSEAMTKSRESMKGKCLRMLAFKASFLPWFILCAAILPAGYVIPYYKQSLACYKALVIYPISR